MSWLVTPAYAWPQSKTDRGVQLRKNASMSREMCPAEFQARRSATPCPLLVLPDGASA